MTKRNFDYSSLENLFDAKGVYQKNGKNLDALWEKLKVENKELEKKFLKEIGEDEHDKK